MQQIFGTCAGLPYFNTMIAGQIDQGSLLCACKDLSPFLFCIPNHLQSIFFGTPDEDDSLLFHLLYSLDLFPYHASRYPLL
ncbi:MAG: hypothetical protein GKC07_02635 [Methanomicrobiales archaeon]|nr:hypothetical protein [Methanomicrobiales archaeon]